MSERAARRPHLAAGVALLLTAAGTTAVLSAPAAQASGVSRHGVSAGNLHTVLAVDGDRVAVAALKKAGASRSVDYGATSLWTVPAKKLTEVNRVPGVTGPDELARIDLRGVTLDTTAAVPAPDTLAATATSGRQLRLVQFAGPVRPAWVKDLTAAGAQIVSYLPANAYVVYADGAAAARLDALVGDDPVVQYSGPFDPSYRLDPVLRDRVEKGQTKGGVDVTVQVVDGPDAAATLAKVTAGRTVLSPPYTLLGLRTVSVRMDAADLAATASLPAVLDVEGYAAPEMNDEVQDQLLAGNITTTSGGATVPSGPGYLDWLQAKGFPTTPSSYPQVTVVDDGIDNGTATPLHPDFYQFGSTAQPDRLTVNGNCTTDASADSGAGHGNLNAGIVGGYNDTAGASTEDANGYQYGLGVSPYGRVAGLKIFTNGGSYSVSGCGNTDQGVVQAAYAAGADMTTNSWGANVAGAYDASSQAYDALTRDASGSTAGLQQMLHIFSAGNSGSGAKTIGSPGTAKNVLTVGATENVREDGTLDGCSFGPANNDSDIASFSSRGPTADGRSKPDVVAAGTHVEGPASQAAGYDGSGVCGDSTGKYHPVGNTLYTWSSGTSHSTPGVAGAVSLIQNYYGRVLAPGQTASPAMLRALVVNIPRYLSGGVGTGDTLPSPNQGWGVPNLGTLFDPATKRVDFDQQTLFTASGQSFARSGSVADTGKPVRVTLAFTDAPGATTGASYVNNLDLEVTAGGTTYRGNVFANGLSTSGGAADAKNNVENVWLPAGTTGPVTVRVIATNIAGDAVPGNGSALDQDFALTASNLDVQPTPVGAAAGVTVTDSRDANSTVDPGEDVTVQAAITNVGDATAPAGTGTLTVLSGPATIVQGSSDFPTIAAGSSQSSTTPYQLKISPAAACGAVVTLRHAWTAGGQTVTEDKTVRVGGDLYDGAFASTASGDVPKAIPDNNATGVSSTIALAGTDPVAAVRVHMSVTHTWDGDVTAKLTSPAGTVVTLVAKRGGSGDNFNATTFDDTATTPVSSGTPPFAGTYRPETPLSALRGQATAGTWTLTLTDSAATDTGTLTGWSLDVAPLLTPACAQATAVVDAAAAPDATEGAGQLDFPVTLTNRDASTSYAVQVTTAGGTATPGADYAPVDTTLTWAPGDANVKHVLVTLVDDHRVEPGETVGLHLASAQADPGPDVSGTIVDDDHPTTIAVGDATTDTEDHVVRFPVTLTGSYDSDTYTVHVATSDGTATAPQDYAAVDRTLTFGPGDARTKFVEVTVVDDAVDEPDETLGLTISDAESSATGTVAITTAQASGTIADNDATPTVSVGDASVAEGAAGGGGTLSFPVTLSGPRSVPVTVDWSVSAGSATAGSDFTAASGTVTFAPGDTAATVTVAVLGDALDEADETVSLTLANPSGADPGTMTGTGTITDDDAAPTVTIGNAKKVVEGKKGTRKMVFTVTMSAVSGRTVSFTWATKSGTAKAGKDFVAGSGTVTLAPGQRTATIVVKVKGDRVKEKKREKLSVVGSALANATWARSAGVGKIIDDD
ncbi:S8 family serine peptidase [Nocardioides sp. KIGAM211]|uniref:S8 family serine peptidase n=1 Tax=Nocardioides luti TaxID=2761101 RepID=A0A7X0VBX1_9ACTN|nr:Calx-beta domain-containing protein [Nocardioides luti]MBB6628392.1 S8 family serine peptidase [Nocardioides luti]